MAVRGLLLLVGSMLSASCLRQLSRATGSSFFRAARVTGSRRTLSMQGGNGAHGAPSGTPPSFTVEEQAIIEKFKAGQEAAPRLTIAEEVRTLVEQSIGFGVLSTNSVQYSGFPTGSVVGFWLDAQGLPFFSFSTMSAHTTDVNADGKVSLTVMASDFKGAAEGRVVLVGNVVKVTDKEESDRLRELYLSKHKDAFWVQFGDFSMYKMADVVAVRFVGGFARAGTCSAQDYKNASPDPIASFVKPVMTHMNDDHADSIVAMVKHYAGVPCSEAKISAMDRLGMTVNAKLELGGGGMSKVRLTFPRPVAERKAIKEVLVEMTKASSPKE